MATVFILCEHGLVTGLKAFSASDVEEPRDHPALAVGHGNSGLLYKTESFMMNNMSPRGAEGNPDPRLKIQGADSYRKDAKPYPQYSREELVGELRAFSKSSLQVSVKQP